MKSKLSAALVAGACVLAVSPAFAISVTYNPMATMSSVPGAVLFDDFDFPKIGGRKRVNLISKYIFGPT